MIPRDACLVAASWALFGLFVSISIKDPSFWSWICSLLWLATAALQTDMLRREINAKR